MLCMVALGRENGRGGMSGQGGQCAIIPGVLPPGRDVQHVGEAATGVLRAPDEEQGGAGGGGCPAPVLRAGNLPKACILPTIP